METEISYMKKPGILIGALVGFLITLPVLAVFYIGNQIAGFPFVPFSFFDNVRDLTPGGVIAFSINAMVNLIRGLNLGPTDSTAKFIEQSMAVESVGPRLSPRIRLTIALMLKAITPPGVKSRTLSKKLKGTKGKPAIWLPM